MNILGTIRSTFFNGFFTLLPITLTMFLFSFSFRLIKSWLEPLHAMQPEILRQIPHSEIVLVFVVIFIVGIILKLFIMQTLISFFESIFERLPLISTVYTGIKQLVHAFSSHDKLSFKKVVLLEFPRKDMYSLGFLTSELPKALTPKQQERVYSIFVPTTPNPTTGYFVVAPEKDFTVVDLTTQEAMALIISGGIIQPTRYQNR